MNFAKLNAFKTCYLSLPVLLMVSILGSTESQSSTNQYEFGIDQIENTYGDNEFELPELGSNGGRFIEANQHQALGEWSIQRMNGSASLLKDPWSQHVLETLAWQINSKARTQAPLALLLMNNASINAFAIPGGVMGINTGTIIESKSMDEVASVVAHEVAHLSQRHYEHRDEADTKALIMQIGGLVAAMIASSADGNAATAIMMGSQTAALNSQMAFSRSNEREADRIGMQLMAKSGYDPRAMPRFFAILDHKTQLNMSKQAYLPSFIMSHPLSSERLSEAQSRAKSYKVMQLDDQHSQVEFDLLKWRLKVLTKQVNDVELRSAAMQSVGATLALAYWLGTKGEYSQSNKIFDKMHETLHFEDANIDLLLAITEAQVVGMQSKWLLAEGLLQPYYRLYPERRDIKLYLAEAWLQLGKYKEVITILKPVLNDRAYDVESLYFMQRAYALMAKQNDTDLAKIATIHTLRYRSLAELWQARYNDALVSLAQAKKIVLDLEVDSQNDLITASYNTKPLLALIAQDIKAVKIAKDFEP